MAQNDSRSEVPLAKAAELLQTVARPLVTFIFDAIPIIIEYSQFVNKFVHHLPLEYVEFFFGFMLCFYGGSYPTVFAALQAAEYGGIVTLKLALKDISSEAMRIVEENKKENQDDANLSGKELLRRKTALVFKKMDPEKVNNAMASIYKVWISVLAVLSIEFARTIALSLAIGKFINKLVDRFVAPTIRSSIPPEYEKWVPILTGWLSKSIGLSIAWAIQTVLSSISSAIAGGLIMSRAMLLILVKNDINLGGLITADHEATDVDEIASYVFAFAGICSQFKRGFSVPFPLNVVLYPVQLLEYYIRWSITK